MRHWATGFAFVLGLAEFAYPQQPAKKVDTALRTFASNLEKCQDIFIGERHWGKKPLDIERLYLSHPQNVVWRSREGGGVVEFSSSVYVRVPKETAKKYAHSRVVEPADLPVGSDGIAFVPTVEGFPVADTHYRYELGLSPDGVSILRILRTSVDGKWEAVDTGHPCAPKAR